MRYTGRFFRVLMAFALSLGGGSFVGAAGPGGVPDSIVARAEALLQAGNVDAAVSLFSQLGSDFPGDARLQIRLGYAYLKRADFKAAGAAFQKAKALDGALPDAYVGQGLVYTEAPAQGMAAYYAFRKALGEARRAVRLDSTCATAYRLLGELYERFQEDHAKAVSYYRRYVDLEPNNPDGLYFFGLACVQADQYGLIDRYIRPYSDAHPEALRLLPLVAQGYFFQEQFAPALACFKRYLRGVDATEQSYYTDISPVASEKELVAYRALTTEAARVTFLKQFWQRRDPDILTAINERLIEHDRRVWFARTFFSKKVTPWDRRGEVYIRYGAPDFRSRSIRRQFALPPAVETVRTRMAVDLYGPASTYLTFTGPVFPIRTMRRIDRPAAELARDNPQEAAPEEDDLALNLNPAEQSFSFPPLDLESTAPTDAQGNPRPRLQFDAYAPVTSDNAFETVPWETWTYTQLQQGIELTFTDEVGNGVFDFAPIPPAPLGDDKITNAARMMTYAPGIVYEKTRSSTPDFYRPGVRGEALNFYYDMADFRGADGNTKIEVYYGVPPGEVEIVKLAQGQLIQAQGALALADDGHVHIYRAAVGFAYENSAGFNTRKGAFVPDELSVSAPPGTYQLQVQLKDKTSGRLGVYKQDLEVPDYRSEQLQMSGILMASAVKDRDDNARFQKGDVAVIPMPSRAYPEGAQVFAYFEIYNLKPDAFGQTRFKVQYRVQYNSTASVGVAGAVSSGLRALFSPRKPQVSVAYDQVGEDATEQEYVALDLKKARAGVNVLEVTVKDRVSGQESSREAVFLYGKRPEH